MSEHQSKYVDGPLRTHLKLNMAGSIVLAIVGFGLGLAAIPSAAAWWWLLGIFGTQLAWANVRHLRRVPPVEIPVKVPHWFPPLYDAGSLADYGRFSQR